MCEVLKARGRSELEKASPVVANPEGVGYASREHHEAARAGIESLISADNLHVSFNDVEGFVLGVMHVKGRAERWCSGLLDEGERASGVIATRFDNHQAAKERHPITLVRAELVTAFAKRHARTPTSTGRQSGQLIIREAPETLFLLTTGQPRYPRKSIVLRALSLNYEVVEWVPSSANVDALPATT
jgi:hypothetical protein